jgi:hypothetical protein
LFAPKLQIIGVRQPLFPRQKVSAYLLLHPEIICCCIQKVNSHILDIGLDGIFRRGDGLALGGFHGAVLLGWSGVSLSG